MTPHQIDVRPQSQLALTVLASLIRERRLELGWSQNSAAARLRISPTTFRAIEQGAGQVAIGTVFNAATLMGVPLFSQDAAGLSRLAGQRRHVDSLLPGRSVSERIAVDDDF